MPRKLSKSSYRHRKGQKSETYLQNTVCTSASLLLRLNRFSAPKPVNHAVWIYCLANQLLTIHAPLPIKLKLYFKSSTITTTKPPNACRASRQQLLWKIAFKPKGLPLMHCRPPASSSPSTFMLISMRVFNKPAFISPPKQKAVWNRSDGLWRKYI